MFGRLVHVLLASTMIALAACSGSESEATFAPEPAATPTVETAAPEPAATPTVETAAPEPAATPTPEPIADPEPTGDPGERAPNIVVFMTDDQTVPQMDVLAGVQARLADRGMTFTQAIVNLPSCCPSRATFLTGQHAVNHGVLTNAGQSGGFGSFEGQDATLATALQAAGYHTVFVGKYLNGFGLTHAVRYTPPGWSDFRGLIAPTEVLYHSPALWVNGEVVEHGPEVHTVDLLDEVAAGAISASPHQAQPIFAVVSYPAPHAQAGIPFGGNLIELMRRSAEVDDLSFLAPPVPAPRHRGRFGEVDLPSPPSFNEADTADKPGFLQRRQRGADRLEVVEAFHRAALESLLAVDESVTRLTDLVDGLPEGRPTWYLFTSDNGLLLGEHRHFGAKYLPYEEIVRVPLLVSGPGVEPGSRSPALVSNVDLAPTIYDIAGADAQRRPDGRSLLPLLLGDEVPRGRAVLIQGFEFRPSSPPYRAVHTGSAVYVEWLTGERELYDLVADPFQLDNLADQASAAALRARLEALLRELEDCAGPQCAEVGSDLDPPDHPRR